MRKFVSWAIWAFLMLILLIIPLRLGLSARNSLPQARAVASAYAASPGCAPSTLLRAAATPQSPRASSAAPSGALCEVQRMTIVQKRLFRGHRGNDYYYVIMADQTGRQAEVQLEYTNYNRFWNDLRPPAKVNVQLLEGKVAMIANGAALAPTIYQPTAVVESLRAQLIVSWLFSVPFFVFLGISIRAWMKKPRTPNTETPESSEMEAPAWVNSPTGAPSDLQCPNFRDRPLVQVRRELEAAGYRMGRISFIPSTSSPTGTIIAQTPAPGSQVAPGAAFNFQVTIEGKT